MSKTTKKAPAKTVAKKAAPAAAKPAEVKTLKVVKTEQKYEGARALWYAALRQHDGKSTEDFVTTCMKQPPATPKSGKAEDPRGWLRYFVREGVATLS